MVVSMGRELPVGGKTIKGGCRRVNRGDRPEDSIEAAGEKGRTESPAVDSIISSDIEKNDGLPKSG